MAASLSPAERKAIIPLTFFSDAVGESLLRKGVFASRDGWPMTPFGAEVLKVVEQPLPTPPESGGGR
jgi:hypothetical protein